MSKKSSNNPGSLDFIENALNENSKDLKNLLEKIESLSKMSNTSEPSNLKSVENSLGNLQEQINNITSILNIQIQHNRCSNSAKKPEKEATSLLPAEAIAPIVIKCKNWEEFLTCAASAQQVSVTFRESDKMFEADALKGNQIVAYVGPMPELALLLKEYLSTNLSVASENVFEGTLT